MITSARLSSLPASPQKVRLVVDLIRGKNVEEAVNILHGTRKAVAAPLEKLLKSAIANAENRQEQVDVGRLYVREAYVDPAAKLPPRRMPASMGRVFLKRKRRSHVTIKLDTRKG